MSKKKVCILYTGGTIGMVPTEFGYAPKKDYICKLNRHTMGIFDKGFKKTNQGFFSRLSSFLSRLSSFWISLFS